jgi:hypothetical protein
MLLDIGIVYQTLPEPSTFTKSGWPYPDGSWTEVTKLFEDGSNKAIFPGGVEDPQWGEGSQPGIATHTRPLASKAVPQGSDPGVPKSVTDVTPEARAEELPSPATRDRDRATNARAATGRAKAAVVLRTGPREPFMPGIEPADGS